MLNGEFTHEQAAALAERLEREAPGNRDEQVRRAVRLTTGREPSEEEVRHDAAFAKKSLKSYCLLLLNANEFVYLD